MKFKVIAIATLMLAIVALGAAITPGVLAQTQGRGNAGTPATTGNTPSNVQRGYGMGMGAGMGMRNGMANGAGTGMMGGMGMMGQSSLIAVAADQLDMTTAELITALGGTRSIAQVAAEHNVATNTIIDAFLAPRVENLNAAVAAGRITQEQADQMLDTMRTHVTEQINEVWTARGPGQGTGFVDEDGDGVCDNMPAGGRGRMGGGPRQ